MENQMEVVTKNGELLAQEAPTPQELMLQARDAARALKAVIDSNDRPPVSFNGKQYLEYPHWQTLAKFYHCSVATEGAEFVEIQGVPGFKARAIVIDEHSGIKIGSAEAFCLKDEPNWKNKPMFQLASMAQTRAGAKALANKFRYVAIVAGYEPTPKEEMDGVEVRPAVPMPKPKSVIEFDAAPVEQAKKVFGGKTRKMITEPQRKMLFAKSKAAGVSEDAFRQFIKEKFGTEHTAELAMDDVDTCVQWVDQHGKAAL